MKDVNKNVFLILLATIFLIGFWFKIGFADQDSYYWLKVFGIKENFFPFIKTFIALQLLACLFIAKNMGELFDKKNGWWASLILFATTFFPMEFYKFENDTLGYVLGFLGLYYIIKYWLQKNNFDFFKSLCSLTISGLIWGGAIYWALLASIFALPMLFLWAAAMLIGENKTTFFNFFSMSQTVAEQVKQIGILAYGPALLLSVAGMMFTPKRIVLAFLIALIPCWFMAKLYILGIPFLILIILHFCLWLSKSFDKFFVLEKGLIIFSLYLAIFFTMNMQQAFPTHDDLSLIWGVVEYKEVQNDFTPGRILDYYGGNGSCMLGGECDFNYAGYVLDVRWKENNCEKMSESDNLVFLWCNHKTLLTT